jgi:hypothetical protein
MGTQKEKRKENEWREAMYVKYPPEGGGGFQKLVEFNGHPKECP